MGREPQLMLAVGRKGTGKTYTTMQLVRQYVRGNSVTGTPPRKVIIFDTNREYSDKIKYPDIQALALKHVRLFSVHPAIEIRRIPPIMPDGSEMTPDQKAWAVDYIMKNFYNGLVVLEDINSYIGDYMPMDVVGVILSQRHKGIDTILHYHSLGRVQKKIWPHVNKIRMHRVNDGVSYNKNKFPDKYECFSIAENIVNRKFEHGNPYFYVHIDNDIDKIHADITTEERDLAIQEYIGANRDLTIKRFIDHRDEKGRKTYTPEAAYAACRQRLIDTYFPASPLQKEQKKTDILPPAAPATAGSTPSAGIQQ